MELQKEIDLLKEKIELLEKLKELQDVIRKEVIYVPMYPSYPSYPSPSYPSWPQVVFSDKTGLPIGTW